MIRPLAALTRQVQQFFHTHLIGLYRWEDITFRDREKHLAQDPASWPRTRRGKRIRPERSEGKYHALLRLEFGPWDLTVEGPSERPPLGWIKLEGFDTIEGPLDLATWDKIAEHIKRNHTEIPNGIAGGESAGKWGS